ncbi:hypothetical protein ACCO45_004017 [Purpureocillium lilacinum]|uniref:Uncharacterized protein n=1 Tax=Purpureocillium lilacinum TaxID=33203 RepID=A0ACC4E1J6_PURLI
MDATDCPATGGGLPLANINPLPTFFIRFFPVAGHQTATQNSTAAPLSQTTIRWTSCLALRDALYRAPAWTRVPAESRIPSKPFTIMKKIGMPTRYVLTTRPAKLLTVQELQAQDAKLELPSAKRRRSNKYTPSVNEIDIHASPQSMAEITNAFMQAKVDLANSMLALDPEILLQDIEYLKKRATTSTPAKRRIDRNYHIERDGLVGGYRLRGYDQVWHIVLRTIHSDTRQVNLKAAAIAEVSSNLQELRRDPRKHIAHQGAPELSDIADVTEPESSLALMRPPRCQPTQSLPRAGASAFEPHKGSKAERHDGASTAGVKPEDRALADQVELPPVDASVGHAVSAVDHLAKIAEERCGGAARVVIEQAMDKLFVRFKLPLEFASKFAESQRHDESRFTVTPSAISSSPRVRFPAQPMNVGNESSPATPGLSSESIYATDDERTTSFDPNSVAQDQTLVVGDFGSPSDSPADATTLDLPSVNTTRLLQTPTMTGITYAPSPGAALQTPAPFPALQTPTLHSALDATEGANVDASSAKIAEKANHPTTSQSTPTFTPLNNPGQLLAKNNPSVPEAAQEKSQESQQTKRLEFDSPGRDYMRDFIMRSKPKRLSTTETGSPIAPPSKRQPLVAKSPNMESPQKAKRKADEDELAQGPTPLKKELAASPNGRAVTKNRSLIPVLTATWTQPKSQINLQ